MKPKQKAASWTAKTKMGKKIASSQRYRVILSAAAAFALNLLYAVYYSILGVLNIMAIVKAVKQRKNSSPLLRAIRSIGYAEAAASLSMRSKQRPTFKRRPSFLIVYKKRVLL